MANVPVGPHRVSPAGQVAEDAPKEEAWRENAAALSRNAGNSFKSTGRGGDNKKGLSKPKLFAGLIVLFLVAAFAFWWMGQGSNVAGQIDKSKYQAVFFTNGQVYFGKLSKVDNDYYKLTEIFYIQESQQTDNPQETESEEPQQSSPQLIKLGNEIHGPEDAMIINKDQVLFFENLKTDGKVSDVILKDKAQKQ